MFMKDKKKSIASILVAKLGKPELSEKPMSEGAEQDDSIALKSAAEEIMSAIESKDSGMLVSALKSFYEMCDSAEDESESESESES